MRLTPKESEIQKAILDYLALKNIWHIRLNAGAMSGYHKGKRWFVKFGKPGMADILATIKCMGPCSGGNLIWIEVKRPGEKQSPEQIAFEKEVIAEGHEYLVAHSVDEVMEFLRMSVRDKFVEDI